MTQNFQTIMLTLQHFWADRGCLLWQPYYTHVGAGTMNPATSLRVLGPEPWNVAYVEPSVRPDDGRYGDNPNRLQQHYQFQVILKPDPGNPQEMYLDSLKALGINPRDHDIRFVEDNWESPALGAWGLGWEVWLDGQEITQFTYFQQAGGMPLNPVSVEITYGLERIAIALQRISGFRDIEWGAGLKYGDINLAAEREHSTYYFEIADVENLFEMYKVYNTEARNALARGLVLPAHDYVLKLSHTFNILDTRGAIGVTERQAYFKNMRELARSVAEAYVSQREEMGFPWLAEAGTPAIPLGVVKKPVAQPSQPAETFLFEIGVEELPPGDIASALDQLGDQVPALLEALHLAYEDVRYFSTPRRLVVRVKGLATGQPDREMVFRGPPADRAFDADGRPTRAAEGFARGKGLTPADLVVEEKDGGRYVFVRTIEKGRPAPEVLAEALPGLISGLRFGKSMRWNDKSLSFSRPIRWLLALLGNTPVSFEYAGLLSGSKTRSLRFITPETLTISTPQHYFDALSSQGIILDVEARRNEIRQQIDRLAGEIGGIIPPDPGLLEEVLHLVEAPTAFRGSFDSEYLELPPEVLVSVMKKHQRYFPVFERREAGRPGTRLLPYFIAVRNGDERSLDIVAEGNEHVIRARFSDAAFFIENDHQRGLENFRAKIDSLVFQAKLGSMLDKSRRMESLVSAVGVSLGLTSLEQKEAIRVAALCKADLASEMVVEMTSLQGVMGRYYALEMGESDAVAQAIEEHYWPRQTGDKTPGSRVAVAVGLADRLDSLVGLFGVGLAPSGNKDPFGLRRAAIGLVQILVEQGIDFNLRAAVRSAATRQPVPVPDEVQEEVLSFIAARLANQLREAGFQHDVVEAVVSEQGTNPSAAARNAGMLSGWIEKEDWETLLQAYARCVRITRDYSETFSLQPALLAEPSELRLFEVFESAVQGNGPGNVDEFLALIEALVPAIDTFFLEVLVMADDPKVRENRLALLQCIAGLASGLVDMSRLEGF